ncbi:winged helix-turn-helix transcriptional regulator [Streptomyces griseoloalbus]|uniref:DNA-binding HxlR family transcriptional regulator n=1 Tax=Streptomyces griseoloalbus TaxID=67303 RepID=A0A7W8F610_9ACTN|nr:winged helix-turn-helix transcriptional regulator [Streptomyces albaduncus]MBB5124503.1 DNA-binding HxlR family transcriptional regulator [Streptomyces albaduncus]GGW74604.1 hypothetical protein GCM10010340_61320 [Streptomyces albaduncus]
MDRVPTLALRNLEREGPVGRTVHATVPPKAEYELTPATGESHETLPRLTDWAEGHRVRIAGSRAAYDTGHAREPADA